MKRLISLLTRHIPRPVLQRLAGGGLKLVSLFYAGNRVQCPICERNFRRFLPYGRIRPRPNALCPNCLSLERHRLIWLYLKNETSFFDRPARVLHIAPEVCFLKRFEKIHGEGYVTADIESPLAKVKMDIHDIPFEENSFDFVLCNHVLEHVADDRKAMLEIRRVLKHDGMAILQVPFFHPIPEHTLEDSSITDPQEREVVFGQSDHVRRYGHDFPERIRQAGLKPVESEFVNTLSEATIKRNGLAKGEILYGGRKQAG